MGRLINADVLIERIYEYQREEIETEDIIHSIKTMPTVYDLEKMEVFGTEIEMVRKKVQHD